MVHLLNLLAAIALLVWGTYLVRTGILRVLGANLRSILARCVGNRFTGALSGVAVTALVQSSTATALIVSSFVGQGAVGLAAALAVMLGADVGTSMMAVFFSFDLSWLSPLFIFIGVVLFIIGQGAGIGRVGGILIGLGLMLLALQLVRETAGILSQAPAVKAMLGSLSSDLLLEITVGAALAVASYSSLAVVLLTATLATSGVVPLDVALGLVLGANLGSGLLAVLTTSKSSIATRQVPLGNLCFKIAGVLVCAPFMGLWLGYIREWVPRVDSAIVFFHLGFNIAAALLFLMLNETVARLVEKILPNKGGGDGEAEGMRPRHLDATALGTPSLAISCATREALHQADIAESMLSGLLEIIKNGDLKRAEELRKMDDAVDSLYSAIKYYMAKISRQDLSATESRRWADVVGFSINIEQTADIIERVILDVEDRAIKAGRSFSDAGLAEIVEMHGHLMANLRLAISVFLHGNLHDARMLIEEKARFRDLERACAAAHMGRLAQNTVLSIESSALHLDLISDLRRINSHICSIAYPLLESAGALAASRLVAPTARETTSGGIA